MKNLIKVVERWRIAAMYGLAEGGEAQELNDNCIGSGRIFLSRCLPTFYGALCIANIYRNILI